MSAAIRVVYFQAALSGRLGKSKRNLCRATTAWLTLYMLDKVSAMCTYYIYIYYSIYTYSVLQILYFLLYSTYKYIPLYICIYFLPVCIIFCSKFLLKSALFSYYFLCQLKSMLHFLHTDFFLLGYSQDIVKSTSCYWSLSPQTVTISINQSRNSLIKLSASRRRA